MSKSLTPLLRAEKLTPDEARLWLALSLYREGQLSTGLCAELAGLDRRAFMDELARHRVEPPHSAVDWEADVRTLQRLGHLRSSLATPRC